MTPRSLVPFWKMTGSGNDFIVIDNRDENVPEMELPLFTRSVCRRRYAVGADGVVLIESPRNGQDDPGVAFRWRYFNADGSEGDFCGNGAMCGARFALLNGIAPRRCHFRTPAGVVEAEADTGHCRVRLTLDAPGPFAAARELLVSGQIMTVYPIQVGVPHAIVFADAYSMEIARRFPEIGREIRYHESFAPHGTNVDLVTIQGQTTLHMRTYERGIEAETLACGSGAIASAIVSTARGLVVPPVAVVTSGGAMLTVDFSWDPATRQANKLALEGEARVVAKGEISEEAYE
jgi:diaminopimelate epimerase